MALRILGIRHGEVHNPKGVIYSGLPGYVLSEAGRAEATTAAGALSACGVQAIYASPLERAAETAGYLAEATGVDVVTDERLVEWKHWEQWAGLTWDQLREMAKESFDAYLHDPGSVTSGESLAELADRMQSWMTDVARDHDGLVVGVTHLEPLRAILLRLLDRPAAELLQLEIGHAHGVRLAPTPSADALAPASIASLVEGM